MKKGVNAFYCSLKIKTHLSVKGSIFLLFFLKLFLLSFLASFSLIKKTIVVTLW